MYSFDLSLFQSIHRIAGSSLIIDTCIVFFATWYVYIVLLVVAYFLLREHGTTGIRHSLHILLVGLVARFTAIPALHALFHRPRPFVALQVPHLLFESSYSFPSGHTVFVCAIATALCSFNKKLALFVYLSAIVIGSARIMGGVHYPSDILGGVVVGIVTGSVLTFLLKRLQATHRF